MAEHSWNVPFLKLMTIVAWVDKSLEWSELIYIKELAKKFRISDEEWQAVAEYMLKPPYEGLHKVLLAEIVQQELSADEITVIDDALRTMIVKDHAVDPNESKIFQDFKKSLKSKEPPKADVVSRIKEFMSKRKRSETHPTSHIPEDAGLADTLLEKIRQALVERNMTLPSPERDLRLTTLIGAAFALVAWADGIFKSSEQRQIEELLCEQIELDSDQAIVIATLLREELPVNIDIESLGVALKQVLEIKDIESLVDSFFKIAIADDELSDSELDIIQKLTRAMHVDMAVFENAKAKALTELQSQ